MAHAISDASLIRGIRRRSVPQREEIAAETNKLEKLTLAVKNRWAFLPPDEKEYITALAYGIAKDPEPLPVYLWPVWLFLWPLRVSSRDASERLGRVMGQFVDTVFNAIERDDPRLQEAQRATVEAALDPSRRSEVKVSALREWNDDVQDREGRPLRG